MEGGLYSYALNPFSTALYTLYTALIFLFRLSARDHFILFHLTLDLLLLEDHGPGDQGCFGRH